MNKQEQHNKLNIITIIINGVRYDAVDTGIQECFCDGCDLFRNCILANDCENLIGLNRVFKQSYKKFEV